jgi:hypothetical protein
VEETKLHVGGLREDAHLEWSARPLDAGDRVEIAVGRGVAADAPATEKRRDRRRERAQKKQYAESSTRFLNVDLDIWSSRPLDALVHAFGRRVVILHAGPEGREHGAHLELAAESDSPDRLLRTFVDLVQRLPPSARRAWNGARAREFNIGVQAADRPHSFALSLEPETLRAVASVRGRVGFTVYGAQRPPG